MEFRIQVDINDKSANDSYSSWMNNKTESWFDREEFAATIFVILVFIRVLVAITGVIGNFLVIVAFVKNKNAIGQNFRYLNNVVLSLAIAGILYSVLGQPFDILYWYYNLSDIGPSYRDTGRTWISTISIIGIYILLIFVLLYPTTIALHMTTDISQEEFMSAYAIAWKVVSVVTIVFPVLLKHTIQLDQNFPFEKSEECCKFWRQNYWYQY